MFLKHRLQQHQRQVRGVCRAHPGAQLQGHQPPHVRPLQERAGHVITAILDNLYKTY